MILKKQIFCRLCLVAILPVVMAFVGATNVFGGFLDYLSGDSSDVPTNMVQRGTFACPSNQRPSYCFSGEPGELLFLAPHKGWRLWSVRIRNESLKEFPVEGLKDEGWELVSVMGSGESSDALYFYRSKQRRVGELAIGLITNGVVRIHKSMIFPLDTPSETADILRNARAAYNSRITRASPWGGGEPLPARIQWNGESYDLLFSNLDPEWKTHVLRKGEFLGSINLDLPPTSKFLFVSKNESTFLKGIYLVWPSDGAAHAALFSLRLADSKVTEATKGPTGMLVLSVEKGGVESFVILDLSSYIEELRRGELIRDIQW